MYSQGIITFKDLIGLAQKDSSIYLNNNEILFLKGDPFKMPFLEKIEFRTNTDEWDIKRQQYTVRTSFNGWKERKYYKELQEQFIKSNTLETVILLNEKISTAYFTYLDYYFGHRLKALKLKEKFILEDKLKIYDILAKSNNDFKVSDLIGTEDDFYEVELELLELEAKNVMYQELFGIRNKENEDNVIDTSGFISFAKMYSVYESLDNNIEKHPKISLLKSEEEERFIEYELEESKTKKILDYAQIRYAGRDNLNLAREFSVGVGIRIPMKGGAVVDLKELELEMLQDENKTLSEKMEMEKEMYVSEKKINELIKRKNRIEEQIKNTRIRFSQENFRHLATKDPLALLRVKESQVSREIDIIELEYEIYFHYLLSLELNGKFIERPLINYLSENLESF